MKLLTVDTVDEARAKIFERAKSWHLKTEAISLGETLGRVLAEDVYAPCDIPGFSRATVDGYAVVSADTAAAGEAIPVFLKQTGSVSMGQPADFSIRCGECAYVPTGAMLPPGADAVVMAEYCESAAGNIAVYEAAASGTGFAEAGEDCRAGELLLYRGTLIRPQETGALAAAGITMIPVFVPLNLSIISSGDELVPLEQNPRPGEIRDINTPALQALAMKCGYRAVSTRVLPDDETKLEAAVRETMSLCDIVVISGGSSQGERDFTAKVIDRCAKPGVFTHGLAIKPGKPTILGWDEESKTLLAGLPGHPVSAMMIFELLLGWLLDQLFGKPLPLPIPARLSCNVPGSPGKIVLQPVILNFEDGAYSAQPVFGKSGMITTLTRANGYIIIDLNKEGLNKNEPVLVHLF
jgi:molybdopterin molybdotransferase